MRKQVGPKICIVFLLALVQKKYNNETKLRNVFLGFLGSRSISTAAGVDFKYQTIYKITFNCLIGLLSK